MTYSSALLRHMLDQVIWMFFYKKKSDSPIIKKKSKPDSLQNRQSRIWGGNIQIGQRSMHFILMKIKIAWEEIAIIMLYPANNIKQMLQKQNNYEWKYKLLKAMELGSNQLSLALESQLDKEMWAWRGFEWQNEAQSIWGPLHGYDGAGAMFYGIYVCTCVSSEHMCIHIQHAYTLSIFYLPSDTHYLYTELSA